MWEFQLLLITQFVCLKCRAFLFCCALCIAHCHYVFQTIVKGDRRMRERYGKRKKRATQRNKTKANNTNNTDDSARQPVCGRSDASNKCCCFFLPRFQTFQKSNAYADADQTYVSWSTGTIPRSHFTVIVHVFCSAKHRCWIAQKMQQWEKFQITKNSFWVEKWRYSYTCIAFNKRKFWNSVLCLLSICNAIENFDLDRHIAATKNGKAEKDPGKCDWIALERKEPRATGIQTKN